MTTDLARTPLARSICGLNGDIAIYDDDSNQLTVVFDNAERIQRLTIPRTAIEPLIWALQQTCDEEQA